MCRLALHSGVMGDNTIEKKPANPKVDEWAERIAAQERSGISVKQFCKENGLTEYSFYAWRKRLQQSGPVRFALVARSARQDFVLGCVTNVSENLQSCAEDGSRPPGVGFQESASNHPEPLRSKDVVVNVRGKGVRRGCQVRSEEHTSEL